MIPAEYGHHGQTRATLQYNLLRCDIPATGSADHDVVRSRVVWRAHQFGANSVHVSCMHYNCGTPDEIHYIFQCSSNLASFSYLKEKCTKALNLLRVIAHTTWGADQQTLLHLYRALIRSKLDYGCIVYGSARSSYLRMLDPFQNHALQLCLGAFRTSPSSSLCILANEPPLHLRRQSFLCNTV